MSSPMFLSMIARRSPAWEWRYLLIGLVAIVLSGCGGLSKVGDMFSDSSSPPTQQQQQQAVPDAMPPETPQIGSGPRKVALLLPLSASGETSRIAMALRQAAELGIADTGGADVTIAVKDTAGTPEAAAAAAQAAIDEGAEIILGPLLASEVQAVTPVAKPARVNVIAFSSVSSAAAPNTFLMSFLPEDEVELVVKHAASRGYRNLSALFPSSQYGATVERALVRAAAAADATVARTQKYDRQDASIAQAVTQISGATQKEGSALLLPESGAQLKSLGTSLAQSGVDPDRIKILGTGLWDDAATRTTAIAVGGWYAGVDPQLVASFDMKFRTRYGNAPPRIASLSYDAAILAVNLARSGKFTAAAIANPNGFVGANGLFRFKKNGRIERGLAILQVGLAGPEVIAAAPAKF